MARAARVRHRECREALPVAVFIVSRLLFVMSRITPDDKKSTREGMIGNREGREQRVFAQEGNNRLQSLDSRPGLTPASNAVRRAARDKP